MGCPRQCPRKQVVTYRPVPAPPPLPSAQIAQLQQQLNDAVRARDAALQRVRDVESENARLSDQERKASQRADALTAQQLQARKDLEQRNAALQAQQSKYSQLKSEHDHAAAQCAQQLAEIRRNNAALRESNAEVCKLIQLRKLDAQKCERLKAELETTRGTSQQQLQEVQARLTQAQAEVEELTTELHEALAAVKESDRARASAEAELQTLRDQQKAYQLLVLACVVVIASQQVRIESLTAEVKSGQATIQKLQQEVVAAEKRMEALQCQHTTSIDRLNAELQAERDASKRQLCQERLDAALALGTLQFVLGIEKAKVQNLEQRYEELQARAEADAEELRATKAALDASIVASREQAAASAAALEALAGSKEAELDALRQEKLSAEAELQRATAEAAAKTEQLAAAEAERDKFKQVAKAIGGVLSVGLTAGVTLGLLGGIVGFLLARNGERVALPAYDPSKYKVVIENERWYPIKHWSKALLPTDRHAYTELDGATPSAPPSDDYRLLRNEAWKAGGEWRVEKLGSPDGWIYAVDFPRTHYTEHFNGACVRRRVHVREYVVGLAAPTPVRNKLHVCDVLHSGDSLESPSGEYRFVHQGDGNVVLYSRAKALWSSKTSGKSTAKLDLQTDGNLVLYDAKGKAHWSSKTSGKPAAFLEVQDDGNVVLYTDEGRALWSTR